MTSGSGIFSHLLPTTPPNHFCFATSGYCLDLIVFQLCSHVLTSNNRSGSSLHFCFAILISSISGPRFRTAFCRSGAILYTVLPPRIAVLGSILTGLGLFHRKKSGKIGSYETLDQPWTQSWKLSLHLTPSISNQPHAMR